MHSCRLPLFTQTKTSLRKGSGRPEFLITTLSFAHCLSSRIDDGLTEPMAESRILLREHKHHQGEALNFYFFFSFFNVCQVRLSQGQACPQGQERCLFRAPAGARIRNKRKNKMRPKHRIVPRQLNTTSDINKVCIII